jgi:hypothetical protein
MLLLTWNNSAAVAAAELLLPIYTVRYSLSQLLLG